MPFINHFTLEQLHSILDQRRVIAAVRDLCGSERDLNLGLQMFGKSC